jgi:hypothetical protein
MTNGQKYTPMLKAGGLWAKTSTKGTVPDRSARRGAGADHAEPRLPIRR